MMMAIQGHNTGLKSAIVLNNTPYSVEINYLAESIYNEEILIKTSVENKDDCFYNHSVIRVEDKKELCRIRVEWKKNKNK